MELRLLPTVAVCIATLTGYTLCLDEIDKLRQEVRRYKDVASDIINLSVNGAARGQSYKRLAEMTDTFGSRIAGSLALENTIDYMLDKLKADGLDNVHGEEVMVPHWVRGNESAAMLSPRYHKLPMLGLGSSIGTPTEGLKAEAIVVRSFEELKNISHQVQGKIVVYNQDWEGYGTSVIYRALGASTASKLGAVATLIRSVTPFSIDSPHTGYQDYQNNVKKIPTACITVEDAEMLYRIARRGEKIVIELHMGAKNLPQVESRNTIAEIKGRENPEQIVLVSGHLDSWDVGQGAMDDGGGAMISWQALTLIRQLNLRPRRTMRVVMWTAEEEGGYGGNAYFEKHKIDIKNYDLIMESDMGTFVPNGLQFNGNHNATLILKEIMTLLKGINATQLQVVDSADTDIALWSQAGVPTASLSLKENNYFDFHHTNGDTMTVQNPHEMDLCSAVWAVVSYIVADLSSMLPR